MRILGLDYGTKKVGVAVGDTTHCLVAPLEVVPNKSWKFLLAQISKIINKQSIDTLLVGLPLHVDGEESKVSREVRGFVVFLRKNLSSVNIILHDERHTTQDARIELSEVALHKKNKRGILDSIAACMLVKDYISG